MEVTKDLDQPVVKPKHINSFAGIKVIALLFLVAWHISIPRPYFNAGSMMCQLLFVMSGFLIAYNNFGRKTDSSYKTSCTYVTKKLTQIYPLYLLMIIGSILLKGLDYFKAFSFKEFTILLSHIFLLQSWSPYESIYFAYNGLAWFLSSLMFCYFLYPFLIKFNKNKRASIIAFITVFVLRIMVEECSKYYGMYLFDFSTYTFPPVRCLEFAMGMFAVPSFMFIKEKLETLIKKKKIEIAVFTSLEIIVLALTIAFVLLDRFPGYFYVFVFCILSFAFAFDKGLISKLFSIKPFIWINNMQLEVYLMHFVIGSVAFKLMNIIFVNYQIHWALMSTVQLVFIFAFAFIYKKFIEKPLAKLSKVIFNKLYKLLGFEIKI